MRGCAREIGLITASLAFVTLLFDLPTSATEPECNAKLLDTVCKCNLADLHPLQGAVGLMEVQHKRDNIVKNEDCERDKLRDDPIRVIAGPNFETDHKLYIIDHHYGALAWLMARRKLNKSETGFCIVQGMGDDEGKRITFKTEHDFWERLKLEHLVHLKNETGKSIDPTDLPRTLDELGSHNDPYRSLAWKEPDKGFCRPDYSKDFLEFHWADFFRTRIPAKDVQNPISDELVKRGIALAHSSDAEDLIGYSLNDCPKEEDKKKCK
jgi:hypothetical protein